MQSPSFLVVFHLVLLLHRSLAQDGPVPIHVVASSRQYGPDGPWQAVKVSFGDPGQDLDLYPTFGYESIILTNSFCAGVSLQPCGSGGLFNPDASRSLDNTSIQFGAKDSDTDWFQGTQQITGKTHFAKGSLALYTTADRPSMIVNASTRLVYEASTVYPDGSKFPLQLGQLALGAGQVNQTFTSGGSTPSVNASLVPGYLWAKKQIPSWSFGLHIGSATLGPPLSLWVGGYDRSRIVGPVSSQSFDGAIFSLSIDLLDIAIGVDQGASPFPYRARENILAEKNSSMLNSLSVVINTAAPYLVLPASTCAAITRDLPVTLNEKYGLYTWNVDDPQYSKIITSPSYLSFIFRASGISDTNMTIKVPFQLLNLTLEAPLTEKRTPYFPCFASRSAHEGFPQYSLGRAFLQAAFFGVEWNQGVGKWFLAQAPGPNTGSTPDATSDTNSINEFKGSSDEWSESWNGRWKPLPETTKASNGSRPATTQRSETSTTAAGGLTTGAKAGIGGGIGIAVLATIAIAALFFTRRRRRNRVMLALPPLPREEEKPWVRNQDHQARCQDRVGHELSNPAPHELETRDGRTHEMRG